MSKSTTEMRPDIRVKIDRKYKGIYDSLKNHTVGDFHELFFLCVCLGHKTQTQVKLSKREDCFWSKTIIPSEWFTYYALFINDNNNNITSLGDDFAIIESMQEYANGGMQYLIDELLTDYFATDSSGNYLTVNKEQLPKELLMCVLDWSEQ